MLVLLDGTSTDDETVEELLLLWQWWRRNRTGHEKATAGQKAADVTKAAVNGKKDRCGRPILLNLIA